ncbi:MAG: asparagine synthase (glutamine-hydrolyzing) [Deltaproteobacteria bacterium]|nr:asparagine synthase (glutamine-hydrolyzing) [Deltaproteobacteria bacterium]
MCGIAGVIEAPGDVVDAADLRRMARALAHRGPDGQGAWRGPGGLAHVGLAHRRLSILDVAGGAQPMVNDSDDERMALVFNGQIYNHEELRHSLEARGHVFRSDHSDTETLLRGLMEHGTQLCPRLSGMFAFAAVDVVRRRLILARDPMGKKPLTIAGPRFFGGRPRLAFASELAALEVLPDRSRDVDANAAARFFAFDFVPDPDSIWRGAWKLPPGHTVEFDLEDPESWDRARSEPYRPLRFAGVAVPTNFETRVDILREAIDDAVARRLLHADVPVGVFLSGGLDSSLVAALAARHTSKLETFSIGFREKSYDESGHARTVARHIGSRHHEQILDERALLDVVPLLGEHLSEPFADHSVVPTYLLARFARERVTVALGGDGGDELFLGYPTFLVESMRPAAVDGLPFFGAATGLLMRAAKALPVSHSDFSLDFKLQRTLDGLREPRPLRRHQLFLTGATDARLRALLSPDVRSHLDPRDLLRPLDDLEREAKERGARDVFDVVTWGYLQTYLAAGVLQKVDRATMAVGLEARAPLLDRKVVDLALSLSVGDKIRGRSSKHILKQVASGLVPEEIRSRPKKGFGMPVASWLNGALKPLVDELLSERSVAADGFLDPRVVTTLVREHRDHRANHRKLLWSMLMWMQWRRRAANVPIQEKT